MRVLVEIAGRSHADTDDLAARFDAALGRFSAQKDSAVGRDVEKLDERGSRQHDSAFPGERDRVQAILVAFSGGEPDFPPIRRPCDAAHTRVPLAELEPAFKPGGKVTAGNSCPLNDGAAAVVVTSAEKARELGLEPRARIVASAVSGVEPEIMGVGPIGAVRRVLDQAGMTIDDVDVVELNEAFAAQVLPVCRELGIDPFGEKLNPHGGAIALGHPYGMTGARIMCTLLNDLETLDKTIGLETMCVGGGQGMAMIVERTG